MKNQIKTIIITSLVWAALAGLVVLYVQVNRISYTRGVLAGVSQTKSICASK